MTVAFTWAVVNGGGTIDQDGLFTAGSIAGDYSNTIKVNAESITTTASITVTEKPVAHFTISDISDQINGVPFQITVEARDNSGAIMNKIKIGVMPTKQLHERMIDIAAGRYIPKRGEPKIWFSSMKSLAEVLSDNNRLLLKIIAESKPENIKELAELSGRQPSNLSRTLKTFERYGFVEMVAGKRSKKPVAKSVDFDICIPA